MHLNEAIEIVSQLDYPCEKHDNVADYFDIIKDSTGVTFTKKFPFSYLTIYKPKQLGLYIIERDYMNNAHSVCSSINIKTRAKSRRYNDISPYEYWTNNKEKVIELACSQLERYKDTYKPDELPIEMGGLVSNNNNDAAVARSLEHECSLCLFRLGMPASFPSLLVTKMLNPIKIANKGDLRVIDISAGWADRLISCCAMDVIYMACDPNSELESCYEEIITKYGSKGKQKVNIIPFEDYIPDPKVDRYNCLYTSPPFFNLEVYSDEATQSTSRYQNIELWKDQFLKPCLKKADDMLDPASVIYIHLSDIINKDNRIIYVDEIINYCVMELKWIFHGVYGHAMKDKDKASETAESRMEKNKMLLKPTNYIKSYREGVRINKKGEALAQTIWYFTKR
jgi:hypothetical protein